MPYLNPLTHQRAYKRIYIFLLITFSLICSLNGQSITIKDILFKEGYYYSGGQDHFTFIYSTIDNDRKYITFRKLEFDTLLNVSDTTIIKLGGSYSLLSSASSTSHSACLFVSEKGDHFNITFINRTSNEQKSVLHFLRLLWSPGLTAKLLPSDDPSAFYLLYQINKKHWNLLLIDATGEIRWTTPLEGSNSVDFPVTFSQGNLFLMARDNPRNQTNRHRLMEIDLKTGEVLKTSEFTNNQFTVDIDNFFTDKDGTLFLIGRKFIGSRTNDRETGIPFASYFDSGKGEFVDIKLNASLQDIKFFIMDVATGPRGEKYFIGETFDSDGFGAALGRGLATGILTMGMVSVTWSNLRFKDILVIPFSEPEAQPILVPLTPRTVTLGANLPSYQFVAYAYRTGQVRYWGHDNSGNLFVMDDTNLKKYDPISRELSLIGPIPEADSRRLLFASHDYLVNFNVRKIKNLVEFKVVPIVQ